MSINRHNYSFIGSYLRGEAAFGFWMIIGKAVAVLNSFLIVFHLTIYQFGIYQLLLAFVGIIESFLLVGINNVVATDIIRLEAEGHIKKAQKLFLEYFFVKLGIAVILSVLVFFGAEITNSIYGENISNLVRLTALIFVLDAFTQATGVFFLSHFYFAISAMQSFVRELTKLLFMSGFILFATLGIREIVLSYVFSGILWALGVGFFIWPKLREYFHWHLFSEASDLWLVIKTYGKWGLVRNYIKQLRDELQPWFIKIFVSTEAVALFSLAGGLVDLPQSLFPANTLSSLIAKEINNPVKLRNIFIKGFKYLFILSLLFIMISLLALPFLVQWLLPKYSSALPLFYILVLAIPFYAVGKLTGAILAAHRDQRFIFTRTILAVILLITLSPIFYIFGGLWGVVALTMLDYILGVTLFFSRVFHFHPELKFKLSTMLRFDVDDRLLLQRVWREYGKIFKLKNR